MEIRIDRDSVHPGDDTESHAATLRVEPTATIGEFLETVRRMAFLPSISGGEATWIIDCAGAGGASIGVIAEQWTAPRLTIPADTPLAAVLPVTGGGVFFRYWCQASPESVLSSLVNKTALPPRYR